MLVQGAQLRHAVRMQAGKNATDDNLLKAQRHERILGLLAERGQVQASALSELFGVSSYTVRRDLDELAEGGRLERVHGGAVLASTVPKTFEGRQSQGLAEKAESARAAMQLLEPSQLVIVDGGSTAQAFVDALPRGYPATFITHSPAIASTLITRDPAEVVLIGGRLDPFSRTAVGSTAVAAYRGISADLCVLGVWGINLTQGISSPYYEESLVRATMVEAANQVVGLAISAKLGTGGPFTVAPADALTHLAVEQATPESQTEPYSDAGIKILRPEAS
jgi:DeoR/GlpR family transcriptional regulator of sugar metabolism